ncbi:ParA family partition ATPase [Aggregatibacter actinomycetemcomitans]|uniref:ParA family partition ATPase n=1 Tax=Aggregatibacter actinomycetemcomitans TaxID=714 RepID=UPI00197C032C|nr:ParA family partition ATPase [Aggregatibacter actinomycetemcomitans]MBN6059375.1 AAA family ATPase [Aggregatibacter actinomycetemcomitans]MBN6087876.1 AAA family ATPase [Aggregatibacter actinomycetemcomitans]
MKVISVLSQKGGSGKSTLSINIARCLQLKGFNVALIDTDPQASAREWNTLAGDDFFPVYGCDKGLSDKDIRALERLADFIIIDGAPRIEKAMTDSIKLADYILIPLKPSQFDIWACKDSIELVQARMQINEKLKAGLVISQTNKQTNLAKEVVEFIKDNFDIPLLQHSTAVRVSYAEVLSSGNTVFESHSKEAKEEITQITNEILTTLGEQQ